MNEVLAKSLGLHRFNREHLVKYLDAHAKQELVTVDADYVQWVAQLINCMYRLELNPHSRSVDIRSIKFMPLQSGLRARLKDKLFLPLDKNDHKLRQATSTFIDELPIINENLTTCLSEVHPVVLTSLRSKSFGVESLSLAQIVDLHILPKFETGPLTDKPVEVLVGYWDCIRLLYEKSSDAYKTALLSKLSQMSYALLPCWRLDDQEGKVHMVSPSKCHFSQRFGNSTQPELLGAFATYVPHTIFTDKWKKFLSVLGVCDFIHIETVPTEIPKSTVLLTLGPDRWAGLELGSDGLDHGGGILSYSEKSSSELEQMVKQLTSACVARGDGVACSSEVFDQLKEALAKLDSQWDRNYVDASITTIGAGTLERPDFNRPDMCRKMRSAFGLFISSAQWLPAMGPETFSDSGAHTTMLFAGQDLWKDTEHLRSLLHTHVPYLDSNMIQNQDMIHELGVKGTIAPDDVLRLIQEWADPKHTRFRTSIKHMATVYGYLMHESRGNESIAERVNRFFCNERCIFVPFNRDRKPG
eukprot:SAG11_NODE_3839_length_2195_cov_1.357347_1_plen_527_part_10